MSAELLTVVAIAVGTLGSEELAANAGPLRRVLAMAAPLPILVVAVAFAADGSQLADVALPSAAFGLPLLLLALAARSANWFRRCACALGSVYVLGGLLSVVFGGAVLMASGFLLIASAALPETTVQPVRRTLATTAASTLVLFAALIVREAF